MYTFGFAQIFAILLFGYTVEPILTKVYMENAVGAAEKVLRALRLELFRHLLSLRVEAFDERSPSELTALISTELDALRSFAFNNVSRDRGMRAVLEAAGAVIILFALSWRLAPVCSLVITSAALAAALFKKFTRSLEAQQAAALQAMAATSLQAVSNIRTVRVFGGERHEMRKYGEYVDR